MDIPEFHFDDQRFRERIEDWDRFLSSTGSALSSMEYVAKAHAELDPIRTQHSNIRDLVDIDAVRAGGLTSRHAAGRTAVMGVLDGYSNGYAPDETAPMAWDIATRCGHATRQLDHVELGHIISSVYRDSSPEIHLMDFLGLVNISYKEVGLQRLRHEAIKRGRALIASDPELAILHTILEHPLTVEQLQEVLSLPSIFRPDPDTFSQGGLFFDDEPVVAYEPVARRQIADRLGVPVEEVDWSEFITTIQPPVPYDQLEEALNTLISDGLAINGAAAYERAGRGRGIEKVPTMAIASKFGAARVAEYYESLAK